MRVFIFQIEIYMAFQVTVALCLARFCGTQTAHIRPVTVEFFHPSVGIVSNITPALISLPNQENRANLFRQLLQKSVEVVSTVETILA